MVETISGPRPSDRWIPWGIVVFFMLLTMVLAHFVWLAVRDYPGTVTDKAYEQGLAYNRILQAAAAQEKLGWQGQLSFAPEEDSWRFSYQLRDADGKPLTDAVVHCWLYRPSSSKLDERFVLVPQGEGLYSAVLSPPAHGIWEARIAARLGDKNFQHSERIVLP